MDRSLWNSIEYEDEYLAQGLGRLDSDSESADGSTGLGDIDDDWGDNEVRPCSVVNLRVNKTANMQFLANRMYFKRMMERTKMVKDISTIKLNTLISVQPYLMT